MNTHTAQALIKNIPLNINDIARISLEAAEALGDLAEGCSRAELLQLLRRVVTEGVKAVRLADSTVSFATAARSSLAARQHRRPTTRRDLRHFLSRLLRVPGLGDRPLRAITARECRLALNTAFGSSPSSYRKGRAILSSVFSHGIRQEWCDRNPVAAVENPPVAEKPIQPLSLEEVQRLERTAQLPEHRAMQFSLFLMLYCGVRPQEVMRLNPQKDIDWDSQLLIIRPATSKTGGGRVVPLRLLADFPRERCTVPRNWATRWQRLRRAALFRQWKADTCRHTFASYHARYFHDLPALQLEMGHCGSSLLLTRYIGGYLKGVKLFWQRRPLW